jgi:hypothetical protein
MAATTPAFGILLSEPAAAEHIANAVRDHLVTAS